MNQNQPQGDQKLSKKSKAEAAGKDIAELAAKGASRYFGGAAGGKITGKALNTKLGQKALSSAGKKIASVPGVKGKLAKAQPMLSRNKGMISSAMGSLSGDNKAKQDSTSNASEPNNDVASSTSSHSEESQEAVIEAKAKKVVKGVMIKVILGVISAVLPLLLFVVLLTAPLMVLGIIDVGDLFGSTSGSSSTTTPSTSTQYTEISSSAVYWWPVGGSSITIENEKEFAKGMPSCTYISSPFGPRILDGQQGYHSGMDISCHPSNKYNIIAVKDGTVETVVNGYSDERDKAGGYGNYVRIKHDDGSIIYYAHLYKDSIKVSVGETVKRGQVLGKMGSSGNSTGTHLHFEIRINSTAVNPANYVSHINPRP